MNYYAVIDLEMCKVPKGLCRKEYGYASEIIQIGVALLDENLTVSRTFMTYVSPQFGRIDSFIQELTGITQKEVTGAPGLEEALIQLVAWLPQNTILVSWSDTDKLQIQKEIAAKNITVKI